MPQSAKREARVRVAPVDPVATGSLSVHVCVLIMAMGCFHPWLLSLPAVGNGVYKYANEGALKSSIIDAQVQ